MARTRKPPKDANDKQSAGVVSLADYKQEAPAAAPNGARRRDANGYLCPLPPDQKAESIPVPRAERTDRIWQVLREAVMTKGSYGERREFVIAAVKAKPRLLREMFWSYLDEALRYAGACDVHPSGGQPASDEEQRRLSRESGLRTTIESMQRRIAKGNTTQMNG